MDDRGFVPRDAADEILRQAGLDAVNSDFSNARTSTGRLLLEVASHLAATAEQVLRKADAAQQPIARRIATIAADIDKVIEDSARAEGMPAD